MENQTFFIDLYGYKDYKWEEQTPEFLSNGNCIDIDAVLDTDKNFILHDTAKKVVESYEKDWYIITEMFIKQRVLRNSPIFKHIMNWGKIKIELI